jgi:hypothetical protein
MSDVDWYYRGRHVDMGTDEAGHTVARAVGTNRVRRVYSVNEKLAAVSAARQLGIREAARKLDIPNSTLRRWTTDGIDAEQGGNRHPVGSPKSCRECGVKVTTWFDTRIESGVIRAWMCRDCYAESWEAAVERSRDRSFFAAMHAACSIPTEPRAFSTSEEAQAGSISRP